MDSIESKSLLDPYKTIGCFANGRVAVSKTSPFSIAVACYSSFKIYSDELAIKMVSPCFSSSVRAIYIYNQFTYVLVGTDLLKIKYHHIVKKWSIASPVSAAKSKLKQNASMLVFDGVIIVSLGQSIYMLPELKINDSEAEQNIKTMNLGIHIQQIVHPVTYINKILAYSHDSIILVNPISQKILFKYNSFTNEVLVEDKKITKVCPTPLIDIVAVCLSSGQIVIFNIRTSKTVFTMKQKRTVTAIAFSESDSLMASADQIGNIILWDLQNKKIVYRLQSAFPQAADFLSFVPGFPLILAVSSKSNAVRQFRINLDDSKTLLQFRDRSGCSSLNPIIRFKCHNNKQITFDTKSATIFSSLYSHSNMYCLPSCLDSALPYHLVSKNYNIELFRQRTVIGKLSIHENAQISKFTVTKKFVIVGTKTRVIKIAVPGGSAPSTLLLVACEWKINDPSQIILHNQHYIYVLCFDAIHIVDFNEPKVVATINQGDACYNLASNQTQSMLALQNRTKQTIQVWDMRSIRLCRQFPKNKNKSNCSKICFTADNRYLLSAQVDCSVCVWSILQNNLYKTIKLQGKIVDMCFTPDNGYFMSVFEGAKEINIWNNYIGKITTSQDQTQVYKFETTLNYFTSDYREKLISSKSTDFESEGQLNIEDFDSLLDTIPDAHDPNTNEYDFSQVSKWMPLVYYDEIKNRNSINKDEEVPSLPFFLDFKNLSQQQAKLNNQLKQESRDRKNKQKQKIDSQLSNDLHEIRLKKNSTLEEYQATWNILSKLSIAEADYQLRKYLILPGNLENLIKMFTVILTENICRNQVLLNVLLMRSLEIGGTQICGEGIKQSCQHLLQKIKQILGTEQDVVERCAAVSSSG